MSNSEDKIIFDDVIEHFETNYTNGDDFDMFEGKELEIGENEPFPVSEQQTEGSNSNQEEQTKAYTASSLKGILTMKYGVQFNSYYHDYETFEKLFEVQPKDEEGNSLVNAEKFAKQLSVNLTLQRVNLVMEQHGTINMDPK